MRAAQPLCKKTLGKNIEGLVDGKDNCDRYDIYEKDLKLLEALVISLGAYLTTAEGSPDEAVREATKDALYNWLGARRPSKGYFDKSAGEWLNVSFGMS